MQIQEFLEQFLNIFIFFHTLLHLLEIMKIWHMNPMFFPVCVLMQIQIQIKNVKIFYIIKITKLEECEAFLQ